MTIDSPDFLRQLCAKTSIQPWSHYVERSPWKLRKENFHNAFAGKMGLYCFWWSGPRKKFLDQIAKYRYQGEQYPGLTRLKLDHDLIPVYVGMATKLANRMRQRLINFAGNMNHYLTQASRLINLPTALSASFQLFGYPERIRKRVASRARKPGMSLSAVQEYLLTHKDESRDLIAEFQEDYYSLLFDNYSISAVPFEDESDLFYAEALSIGALRPLLNHS